MKYLILGSGPAGISAAKAIRGKDKVGEIVVATEAPGPPYLRPLLTDLIMGRVDVAGIADPQAKDLADLGIGVRNGKRALKVDSAGNRVTFADGAEEGYDVLLVATGGKPEMPLPLRKEHPAIFPIGSLEEPCGSWNGFRGRGRWRSTDRGSWPSWRAALSGREGTRWSGSSPTYPGQGTRSRESSRPISSIRSGTRGCGFSMGRTSPPCWKPAWESRSNPPKKVRGSAASPSWWPASVSRRSDYFPAAM